MFKNSNRRGLAIAAALTLAFSGLAAAPAQAAGELVLEASAGTSYSIPHLEDFELRASMAPGQTPSQIDQLKYLVEKTSTTSELAYFADTNSGLASASAYVVAASATMSYITPTASSAVAPNRLVIALNDKTSESAAVAVKVTAFIDANNDGELTSGEYSAVQTVTFIPWSDVTRTVTITSPVEGAASVKAAIAVSGVNTSQLFGTFSAIVTTVDGVTRSPIVSGSVSKTVTALSYSDMVDATPVPYSVSFTVLYSDAAVSSNGDITYAAVKSAVVKRAIDGVTFSATAGDNLVGTGSNADTADVRANAEFAIKAWAYTGSTAVAKATGVAAQAPVVTMAMTSGTLSLTKTVTVNGTLHTSSATLPDELAVAAGTDGKVTLAISTAGFVDGDAFTITVAAQNLEDTFTVTAKSTDFTVARTAGNYLQSAPGAQTVVEFAVEDQFEVATSRTDLRVVAAVAGTGFSTSEVIAAVVSGVATIKVTPTPATATGSYSVTPNLQVWDLNAGLWVDYTNNTPTETAVTVYVSSVANSFSTKPTTVSAQITYGAISATTGSWSAVAAAVSQTGSAVTVTAPGLSFRYNSKVYADSVTVTAGSSGAVSFDVASAKAGTYLLNWTAGSATATSSVTVSPAAASAGKSITFDVTTIASGATATITGTLVDANGNPVHTSGSATITVTYAGAGIPIGTMPTETDEDGEFSFTVLTGSSDKGTGTVTAVYLKDGDATATADKLTVAHSIAVGAAAPVASADQKLTIGTFNGYIAIYAKGYIGQKLSYKVAGKWGTVASLSAFQRVVRKTGAGYEIAVVLYIDGVKIKTETVTTK